MKKPLTYADAGVDIDRKMAAIDRMKSIARKTFGSGVLSEIGGFGGLFSAAFPDLREPVLVASADGVGTKLRVAFETGIHDTVGRDLVNHCVNDILVQGARPLFFLDYLAAGRLDPEVLVKVVSGLARGCEENGCALLGGETAEMPGFYSDGEYDVAGFIVGVVSRPRILDGSRIRPGCVAIGLPSAGLHTNGYSLARKIYFEQDGLNPEAHLPAVGVSVREALLAPHLSYLKALWPLLEADLVEGLAHITGGGFTDNVPRVLPSDTNLHVKVGSWEIPPLFRDLQERGDVSLEEMFRVFNMGIGMILFVKTDRLLEVSRRLANAGERFATIGNVTEGQRKVLYELNREPA
jgi:phosphoribosylformylglycinamidine cyclo-ligase